MSPTSSKLDKLFEADTIPFAESPTLVSSDGSASELSLFNLPTEIHAESESGDAPIPAVKNTRPEAPLNDLYTVTHEIGSGGYGSIWYGVQSNLKRRVALKSLKIEADNTAQFEKLSRLFRQEALTTAYLQHPNVVPVYDLADDQQGRPIVAMKLVEGRQWNRVLAEDFSELSPLEFLEKHVTVLISVVQAVAYAHSKGIIHRDLKPSQVMIGSYGEVLLMDWGLAMAPRDADGQIFCDPAIIVDSHSPLVKPLMPAGTPGYMAPEQTGTDENKLGPWTDVYLLGALLYELLTGYRPHATSQKEDPFAPARKNEITRPEICTPERDIPAQLSALAMKAMATRPADRIASASQFAAELKDYLQRASRRGESMSLVTEVANFVIAEEHSYTHLQMCMDKLDRALTLWPENQMAAYLRHQVLATFARLALSHHDLKLARLQAERIHECHERANILREIGTAEADFRNQNIALDNAHTQAKNERERAETLVRFLLLDLQNELRSTGRPDLVHKVASEALTFFDSLKDQQISTDTLYNRCIAYQQIANVLTEQGRRNEAETAFTRALELGESLMKLSPANSAWKNLQADCLNMLGKLHYSMGRMEMARNELYRALEIRQSEHGASPSHSQFQLLNARTLNDIALLHWREQDYVGALNKITEAVDIARRFHQSDAGNAELQSDLAYYLTTQANIYREFGYTSEALQGMYEALALRIALSEQFPGSPGRAEDVYWVRSNLGLLQYLAGDYESALDNLKHDLAARRRIYEEDMSSVMRNFGITFQLSTLSDINFLLGRLDECERLLAECVIHSKRLAKMDDSNPTAISRHAYHLVQLAELHATRSQWADAQRHARQAVERARYSYWLSPRNSVVMRPLTQALAISARLSRREGHLEDASAALTEANTIFAEIQSRRSAPEHRALKARLMLDTGDPIECAMMLKTLKEERRLDPYLNSWAQERNLNF